MAYRTMCHTCGKTFPIAELTQLPGVGSLYCPRCWEALHTPLNTDRLSFYRWLYVTARKLGEWPGHWVVLRSGEEVPPELSGEEVPAALARR